MGSCSFVRVSGRGLTGLYALARYVVEGGLITLGGNETTLLRLATSLETDLSRCA